MSIKKPLPSCEVAGVASASSGLPPVKLQREEEEVGRTPLERVSDMAEELYRLRDTFFPRDPAEKTAAIRGRVDSALALLDALPAGASLDIPVTSIYGLHESQPIRLKGMGISDTDHCTNL